jgi:hypothetical protein
VTFQSIAQYEKGIVGMTALQIVKACEALGCKTTDLMP